MPVTDDSVVEEVAGYKFTVECSEVTSPEAQARWDGRVDALAAMLLDAWKREQAFRNN